MLIIPERRESERLQVNLSALCWADDDAGLPSTAMILSLSTTGVGLISSALFDRGSTFSLDLTNESLTISRMQLARVVHVRPISDGNWIVGAEFLEPLSRNQVQELTACNAAQHAAVEAVA
jgi:hypothetical protein